MVTLSVFANGNTQKKYKATLIEPEDCEIKHI